MSRSPAPRAALLLTLACHPAGPAPIAPAFTPAGWRRVTRALDSVIHDGAAPGAVLGVSLRGRHLSYGTGRLGLDDPARPDSTTIYDLASLTKVIGLTTLTMLAVSEHRLNLDQPVPTYLPALQPEADSTDVRGDVATWRLAVPSAALPPPGLLSSRRANSSPAGRCDAPPPGRLPVRLPTLRSRSLRRLDHAAIEPVAAPGGRR